mmetsp:Transcript_4423/g.7219  ORF Transcript_4423/g.7219 Transcript_4423/m.7219 type:complete len:101 (-) Transcript_4423:45-347(-)
MDGRMKIQKNKIVKEMCGVDAIAQGTNHDPHQIALWHACAYDLLMAIKYEWSHEEPENESGASAKIFTPSGRSTWFGTDSKGNAHLKTASHMTQQREEGI